MFSKGITTEIRWLSLTIAAALIIGYAYDAVQLCLIIALLGYVFWILYRIKELETWVREARRKTPPSDDFGGVWGEIADDVRLLCKRYDKEKTRLKAIVERVQDMTSALPDAVVLVDNRGNIEWWNTAAKRLLRFQEVDRGHRLVNFVRHPRFVNYFEGGDYDKPLELESLRKEGQDLQFYVHPFGQGERLVVIRDVTRVRRLEQMRKDFVSNVSHELRTPLTVIRGYIETLLDAPDMASKWKTAMQQMLQQSNRMGALVNDLITLSHMETGDNDQSTTAIAIPPLLRNIISDAQSLSDSEHRITLSGSEDLSVLGNERELHSAISNLVFNAVKYSPSGGDIEIAIANTSEGATISVSDHGLGIDPKHIPRITERFYRVDEGRSTAMGGTGLGLAIVKHALMRHDAELRISSRVGQGSTFSCHFPPERIAHKKVA